MEMINRAIEDAADFRGLMDKIKDDTARLAASAHAARASTATEYTHLPLDLQRQPGENRAAHRARLKRERREAKAGRRSMQADVARIV